MSTPDCQNPKSDRHKVPLCANTLKLLAITLLHGTRTLGAAKTVLINYFHLSDIFIVPQR
jgi:hypothetical protein